MVQCVGLMALPNYYLATAFVIASHLRCEPGEAVVAAAYNGSLSSFTLFLSAPTSSQPISLPLFLSSCPPLPPPLLSASTPFWVPVPFPLNKSYLY